MVQMQVISQKPIHWHIQAIFFVGVFAGAWSTVLGKMAQEEHIPTPFIIVFRLAVVSLILAPLVIRQHSGEIKQITWADLAWTAGAGFWMAILVICGFAAMEHTSILVTNVLLGTTPLWVALMEVVFLKTRLHRLVWVGLLVTLSGGVLITLSGSSGLNLGDNPLLGAGLAVFAALASTFYTLIGRKVRGRISFMPYFWLAFASGTIIALAFVLVTGTPLAGYSAEGYLVLVALALFPTLVGHAAYNYVLKHLSATYVSVSGQLGTVFSGVLAFLIFHEMPGALQLAGSLLIIMGIILVNLRQRETT